MHNGSLLDINKLQAQLKRSEDTRTKTEKILEALRADHGNQDNLLIVLHVWWGGVDN